MSNTEARTATIIANHVNENVRFETDATTFGELKQEPEADGLFNGNIRVIVRETRNELSMDKSKLPDGGFTLIVVADKVKSGTDKYDEMGYHDLRRECIERGFSTDKYNGSGATLNVMRAHLRDDDERRAAEKAKEEAKAAEEATDGSGSQETSDRFEEMKDRINVVVKDSREKINEILTEYADILPDSIIPDYSETVEEIKRELGIN